MSRAGLRTLVVAQRVLSQQEYQAWNANFEASRGHCAQGARRRGMGLPGACIRAAPGWRGRGAPSRQGCPMPAARSPMQARRSGAGHATLLFGRVKEERATLRMAASRLPARPKGGGAPCPPSTHLALSPPSAAPPPPTLVHRPRLWRWTTARAASRSSVRRLSSSWRWWARPPWRTSCRWEGVVERAGPGARAGTKGAEAGGGRPQHSKDWAHCS
jgi:hypothetical protein